MRTGLNIASRQAVRAVGMGRCGTSGSSRMSGGVLTMRRMLASSSSSTSSPSSSLLSSSPSLQMRMRMFSTTPAKFGQGQCDETLAETLKNELQHEVENKLDEKPAEMDLIREKWEIEEQDGSTAMVFKREFGNEIIRVEFAVDKMLESNAFEDELFDEKNGSGEEAAETSLNGEEGEEHGAGGEEAFDARGTVTVQKKNTVLKVPFYLKDETFFIESLVLQDAKTVKSKDGGEEKDFGPEYATLDEQVQVEIEDWLAERGVDGDFANAAGRLLLWKEQKEYQTWLKKMEEFVRM